MRTTWISIAVLVGCGGSPEAQAPATALTIAPIANAPEGEASAVPPRVIPREETALEACVAPIDPTVFSKRGPEPSQSKHKSVAPRRPRPPMLDRADPCEHQTSSVECAYQEARTHFEQRRFDLAAKGFRKIALETEVNDLGIFAAQLALESINMLGTYAEPPRPVCWDVIASDIDKLIDRYCRGSHLPDRDDACGTFYRIAQDVRRLHAETLIKTADKGPPNEPAPLYEQAGDEYRAIFDEACAPKTKPVGGARCDELLFNAHRAYRAAGARAKMEAAYRTFFDPRFGLEKSPLADKLGKPAE